MSLNLFKEPWPNRTLRLCRARESGANMKTRSLIALTSDRFLNELHHFLWSEPFMNKGELDQGWNCREHAWVGALLSHWLGFSSVLFLGKAWLITGPTNQRPGFGVFQRAHSWLGVEGFGAVDLSIKPEATYAGTTIRFPIRCLYGNKLIPHGRGKVCVFNDEAEFDRAATAFCERRKEIWALYLMASGASLDEGFVTHAAEWINSPLTDRLKERFGDPSATYASLFLHLAGFLSGTHSSLTRIPVVDAWAKLAESGPGATQRALEIAQKERTFVVAAQQAVRG